MAAELSVQTYLSPSLQGWNEYVKNYTPTCELLLDENCFPYKVYFFLHQFIQTRSEINGNK